jgi:hypothetical protein
MRLGMSLETFTLFHVALSLVGIGSGLVVIFGLLAGKRLDGWTALFLSTTVATSLTGFGFPFDHLLPSHKVGYPVSARPRVGDRRALFLSPRGSLAARLRGLSVRSPLLQRVRRGRAGVLEGAGLEGAGSASDRSAVCGGAGRGPGRLCHAWSAGHASLAPRSRIKVALVPRAEVEALRDAAAKLPRRPEAPFLGERRRPDTDRRGRSGDAGRADASSCTPGPQPRPRIRPTPTVTVVAARTMAPR